MTIKKKYSKNKSVHGQNQSDNGLWKALLGLAESQLSHIMSI